MVSNDPIKDYMRQHGCGFPEALEALAAQLGPLTHRTEHQTRPADAGTSRCASGSARGAGSLERRTDPAGGVIGPISVKAFRAETGVIGAGSAGAAA